MATQALDPAALNLTDSKGALALVWQNPTTRRFVKVGRLDALPNAHYAFQYLPTAWDDEDFVPLVDFPDRAAAYVSDEVPAFFANRILSSERPHFDRYLAWLGLAEADAADLPFEVLARTGAGRATDTFHVVSNPTHDGESFSTRFFVSGVRYASNPDGIAPALREGDDLKLALETDNPVNPKAVLIDTVDGEKVGYVPDWLCGDVHDLIEQGWQLNVVAERVNPDAPAHVRVLCRIEGART